MCAVQFVVHCRFVFADGMLRESGIAGGGNLETTVKQLFTPLGVAGRGRSRGGQQLGLEANPAGENRLTPLLCYLGETNAIFFVITLVSLYICN